MISNVTSNATIKFTLKEKKSTMINDLKKYKYKLLN